jgi:hypothetical protein
MAELPQSTVVMERLETSSPASFFNMLIVMDCKLATWDCRERTIDFNVSMSSLRVEQDCASEGLMSP